MKLREKVVPLAYGNVLEVGMGSGVNLALYDTTKVNMVWGLEPSTGMRKKAQKNIASSTIRVEWLSLPGEQIPLEDNAVDSIVLTYTLCTIPDWRAAMKQMHRVLKADGKLFFCEHGQAPEKSVVKWQDRVNGLWSHAFGGCNLNRPIIESIKDSGFSMDWYESKYTRGMPKFVSYISVGVASKTSALVN